MPRSGASHQMQKEADRVWAGVEKVLFGNGKDIRFHRISDCMSITPARKNGHGGGAETVGIDPGTSTVAVVADVSADCSRASRPSSKKI